MAITFSKYMQARDESESLMCEEESESSGCLPKNAKLRRLIKECGMTPSTQDWSDEGIYFAPSRRSGIAFVVNLSTDKSPMTNSNMAYTLRVKGVGATKQAAFKNAIDKLTIETGSSRSCTLEEAKQRAAYFNNIVSLADMIVHMNINEIPDVKDSVL